MLSFHVECKTEWGERVAVSGTGCLGGWDLQQCVLLDATDYPVWSAQIQAGNELLEFKYVLLQSEPPEAREILRWEYDGPNRKADLRSVEKLTVRNRFGEQASVVEQPEEEQQPSGQRRSLQSIGSGLLSHIDVQPDVRLQRLVRSDTAHNFELKYEYEAGASPLGTGMSGGVVAAHERDTGQEVAVKTLSTAGLSPHRRGQVLSEVQIQLAMDHPHICRLLEVFEEPDRLLLVMERMRGPDLFGHWKRKGRYSESDAACLVRQISRAVVYCHSHGVCHRDLKLENFCLESDADDASVKMIDFGISSLTSEPMTDAVGTLYYVAPEVLQSRCSYNEKCDMWSLGVIAFLVLAGRPPFQGRHDQQTCQLIRQGDFSFPYALFSSEAHDFIKSLLRVDPSKRLDAAAAAAHPWLSQSSPESAATIDPEILEGMRIFVHTNALKRAVLRSMAPVATANEVARWAKQFEALDEQGKGEIGVKDLMERLRSELHASEEESSELSNAMAAADAGKSVSYSSFLAACLSAHTATIREEELKELFQRLGPDDDGYVTLQDFQDAFGDIVDAEDMKIQCLGRDSLLHKGFAFEDFKWLLISPARGVRSLLKVYGSGEVDISSYRLNAIHAKAALGGSSPVAVEAARRENAVWRTWSRAHADVPAPDVESMGSPPPPAIAKPELRDDAKEVLAAMGPDLASNWSVATAESRADDDDAKRRENLAWRKMHMEDAQRQATSVPGAPHEDIAVEAAGE